MFGRLLSFIPQPLLFLGIVSCFFSLLPLPVRAVEGTCSWHGGVNCSIGPDWDGSAICNDGWADSGERYFEQAKCDSTPMCTQYLWQQMSDTQEMQADENRFYDLVNTINRLNLEYPLIEINLQQESAGRGITSGGLAPLISGAQRVNRNAVATSTYEATLLDQKLRSSQLAINKICITSGVAAQQAKSMPQTPTVVIAPPTPIEFSNSPYQNVREHKIYREVRASYAFNSDAGCSKLGFVGEDLAMCQAFAADPNKGRWTTIEKPDTTVRAAVELHAVVPEASPLVIVVPPVPKVSQKVPQKPSMTLPIVKKTQVLASVATALSESTSTEVSPTTTSEVVSVPRTPTLWEKVTSPFRYFWGMLFR